MGLTHKYKSRSPRQAYPGHRANRQAKQLARDRPLTLNTDKILNSSSDTQCDYREEHEDLPRYGRVSRI